jgi:paraquat-inducible protein B
MGNRLSPTMIGGFVIGAIAVLVMAAVVLGSGKLFAKQQEFVCFFPGDLNGLRIGAAVKFRGIQIGTVKDMRIRLSSAEGQQQNDQDLEHQRLPVLIELSENLAVGRGAERNVLGQERVKQLVAAGLRARLATESLVTGLLYIDLDFRPAEPVLLVLDPQKAKYPEIPTVPTQLEQLQETAVQALAKLQKVDFNALITSMTDAGRSIRDLAGSQELKSAIGSLGETAQALKQTAASVQITLGKVNSRIDPAAQSLTKTSDQAEKTLARMESTMASLQTTVAPDSPFAYQLTETLQNVSDASRSMRELADYLNRNPGAIVRGRHIPESTRQTE